MRTGVMSNRQNFIIRKKKKVKTLLIETGNQKDGEKSYLKVHMGHVSHTDISGWDSRI